MKMAMGSGRWRVYVEACSAPEGYVDNIDDCDDTNAEVHGRSRGL